MQDVFLWPQKRFCFTPDGRKELKKGKVRKHILHLETDNSILELVADCALFRFYFTLIYRNAIKSKQDPAQGKLW